MSKKALVSLSLGGIFGGLCLVSSLAFSAVPAQPSQTQAMPTQLPDNSAGLVHQLDEGTTLAQLGRRRRRGRTRTRIPSRTRTRIPSRTRTRIPSRTRTRIPSRSRTRIPSRIPSRVPAIKAAVTFVAPSVVIS